MAPRSSTPPRPDPSDAPRGPRPWLALSVATLGGAGLSPKAPGTVGTLVALPLGIGLQALGTPWLAAAALLLLPAGIWAANRAIAWWGDKDPQAVVVDEAAGLFLALLPALPEWPWWGAAFLLFRLFDILKPGPVGWLDRRLTGGWGVMADDLAAGAMAGGILLAVRLVLASG
ncbi:MAG: phosphatidylglycerophosphatase A [Magnetococcales bacterium]|nr:phosphatidylglycerophosphatase A [Magnetococcales bacterium]